MKILRGKFERHPGKHEAVEKRRKRRTAVKVNWELYALVFLPLVWLAIFQYYPMYGNIIAFKRFSPGIGIWKSEWVGFYYFARFLRSYRFFYVLRNTVVLNLYNLAAGFPIPIILAILTLGIS